MIWLFFIALFLVLLIVVYNSVPWAERKALFYPVRSHRWEPVSEFNDVYIDVKNPKRVYYEEPTKKHCEYVHGWHFNQFPGHDTVMFCHGNSGNIAHRSYIIDICKKFELNLFLFDYRGYGKSSGEPCKYNLKKDGEAVYKYLTLYCSIRSKNIIVWGESLGGFVAIWVASKYTCKCLILLSTFSGLDDALNNYFEKGLAKSLAYGYTSLVSMRYDIMPSRNYIRKVRCPVAILHSKDDDLIPYRCAKINHDSISHKNKILLTIKGGHSSPDISVENMSELFTFCDIKIPLYSRVEVEEMLNDVKTVAERYHNFME